MQLQTAIQSQVEHGPKDLDILAWMGRTALELLGRGGLGYSFDPLVSESKDDFTDSVKGFVCVCIAYLLPGRSSAHFSLSHYLAPRSVTWS